MYYDGTIQFLVFHLSFGTAEVASLISCVILYTKTTSPISRKAFQIGISSYLVAIFVWQFEIHYCPLLNPYYPESILYFNPQLHMFWHILVSIGLYLLALMMLNERALKDGHETKLGWQSMGVFYIPFIQLVVKSD
jgi:dihydroceramidase